MAAAVAGCKGIVIAGEVLSTVSSFVSMIKIGADKEIYQANHEEGLEEWQKVMRSGLGIFCMCFKPPKLSFELERPKIDQKSVPPGEQLGFVVGPNSLDLAARIMTNMDQLLPADHLIDLSRLVCLDIVSTDLNGSHFVPVCFGREVSALVRNMKDGSLVIVQCSEVVDEVAFSVFQKILQLIPRAGESMAPRMTIQIIDKQHPPRLTLDLAMKGEVQRILSIKDIRELREIPDIFCHDPVLKKYRCPITQKLIRELIGVSASPLDNPVYYEAASIVRWLRERPNELPPKWPSIQVEEKSLFREASAQIEINRRLQRLVEDLRAIEIDFAEPCIPRRAREILGDESPRSLASMLARQIRANPKTKQTVQFVFPSEELHSFAKEEPVPAHKIECVMRSVDSPLLQEEINSGFPEKLGAILLGEHRMNEDKVLEIARNTLQSVNFYFSKADLSRWEIQLIHRGEGELIDFKQGCCCFL